MRPGFYRAMALAFCAAPLDSLDAQAQSGWSIFEVAPEASYARIRHCSINELGRGPAIKLLTMR